MTLSESNGGPSHSPLVVRDSAPADLLIRGAHVLDPRAGIDAPHDVLVRGGEIASLGAPGTLDAPQGAEVLDGEGRHLFPGFVDPHVHFRTPGQEHKEDLDSGTRSAAAGGFVAVIAMPNTDPVVDSAPVLRSLREAARREARVPVGFLASITTGLAGDALTEMAELRDTGALGFTDDGKPVHRAAILQRALQYQRLCGGVLALHEEDPSLSGHGVMHEGEVSAAARAGGHPVDLGVDADRPRRRDRRLRGRRHPHPAPVARASRSPRWPRRRRAACGSPARRRRTTCR